ncbi:MAG: pilus assembly protein TadG-related protein [Cellulomonas sp.]
MRALARRLGPVDRGSGTVVAVGLVAVVLLLIGMISLLGRAQSARGAAQTAADLGALAAAQHLAGASGRFGGAGGSGPVVGRAEPGAGYGSAAFEACGIAREVAAANGAVLSRCVLLGGGVVRVTATRPGGLGAAIATARAGPTAPTPWWPVVVPYPTASGAP